MTALTNHTKFSVNEDESFVSTSSGDISILLLFGFGIFVVALDCICIGIVFNELRKSRACL